MAGRDAPVIAVLGASGLIGEAVTTHLIRQGFDVAAVARSFAPAQRALFGNSARQSPVVALDGAALGELLRASGATVIVNCIGVLQDSPRQGAAADAHAGFAQRLVGALSVMGRPCLLIHVSIPGKAADDRTPFSTTKRQAESIIAASGVPHVILRPGFVVAPRAYGGSALIRALAASPFDLPPADAECPFAAIDAEDIGRTVAAIAVKWGGGVRDWHLSWDLTERDGRTIRDVIHAFRRHFGGPARAFPLPGWASALGSKAGDLAARLGWQPPIRSTAFAELRRGVKGDPSQWISETGIVPAGLDEILAKLPSTVQERWFARLYLLKPLVIVGLALFWMVSGLIALTVAFDEAAAILTGHGFSTGAANAITVVSSLADIAVGAAIAHRRSCRAGLLAGIGLSLFYMAGAAVMTPELWIEPLGALVKTGPAIVLMLVALAMLDDR